MKVTSQRRGQGVSGILKYIYVLTKSAWVKNSQKNMSIFVKTIIVWKVILKANFLLIEKRGSNF